MASPAIGTKLSRQICLRYVLTHPVGFREYFTPRASRRRYWHRYTFTPPLLAMDQGDAALMSGRGSGKSYAVLEPEMVRQAIARPGEETMLTSLRRAHVTDRMERAIDYFESVPLFKLFVSRIVRSPSYIIELHNGHMLYGISVGDDPEAKMAQGKHVSTLIVEEGQQFPDRAWLKIQGAKDPRGCRTLMAGVPDGRLDTPFRKADSTLTSFEGRRFRITRRSDPYFDQKTKEDFAETLGGENNDNYLQEVDAEWASPSWSAWDLDSIYKCMLDFPPHVTEVSGKLYRSQKMTPIEVVGGLPRQPHPGAPIYLAMDVGYSQPSEIGIFEWWHDRWTMFARVRLVNRMEHDDQGGILHEIAVHYGAVKVGLDSTEGEGRAIAQDLENKNGWREKVVRVAFNETLMSGYTPAAEEVWETAKSIGTRTLRGFFSHELVLLARDERVVLEFNKEKEQRTETGTKVVTPSDVHIPDMMRVFAVMVFLETPVVPPDAESEAFSDIVWGERPSPWSPTQIPI